MKKRSLSILIFSILVIVLSYQALTTTRETSQDESQAIEIGRYFLDGVNRTTGKVLSITKEDKEPNFYWDIMLDSNVEWDDTGIWDRMLKYDRPDIRETRPCWVIRFEQEKRPGHFYEVWLDVSELIVVGGGSCR